MSIKNNSLFGELFFIEFVFNIKKVYTRYILFSHISFLLDILLLFFVIVILAFPLLFWMYVFVTFFENGVSRKQFLFGIISGVVLSIPLVFHEYTIFGAIFENLFLALSELIGILGSISIFKWCIIFFSIFWIVQTCVSILFQENKVRFFKIQKKSVLYFLALLFFGIIVLTLSSFIFTQEFVGVGVYFGKYVFVSLGSIIAYYIIISFLEEGGKYITALGFSGRKDFDNFVNYICLTACIALGFSFFENILYVISYIQAQGINSGLIQLVFFRSIFSIILHLLSSLLISTGFWYIVGYAHIEKRNLMMFFFLAVLGIISHTFFDVSLSFGILGFLLFYIIAIYLFLSYLTQKLD